LWFGTWDGGASRYDGNGFENFTEEDGLPDNWVVSVYCAPDDAVWFGTHGGGVSRYDGREFRNFTVEDGLAGNVVSAIYSSADGVMWFGTKSGGVSRYDGITWTSLDTRDGLAGNSVWSIQQDEEGYLWFGTTDGGITRYRRSTIPPKVHIVSVRTRKEVYTELGSIPPITVGNDITIECGAIDFRTVPEKRQYRYRIQAFRKSLSKKEMDSDWRKPVKSAQFDWTPEKTGTYTFEVQAIDRDLNYSEPASLSIVISALPFYRTDIFLVVLSIAGSASVLVAIILAVQRWRLSRAEKLRLQQELEDAHRMQLRLLPEKAPSVEGFDIAGFSHPAREVGGDFFDYLSLADGKMGIALADISDKGLKAAMNAMLASGMLREVAKDRASCGEILSALNADLCPLMEKQMFTALGLAILDESGRTLQWANAAQPYPTVKRGKQVFEFKSDSELPLGMMPNVSYPDWELELQSGDVILFYTDGIIEAENEAEEMYGAERLEQVVTRMEPTMNAEEIIEAILQDVTNFVGTAEQYDDMTVVAVRKF
jgi:serine phosphatase RsbU (regulator of sigma subunit)